MVYCKNLNKIVSRDDKSNKLVLKLALTNIVIARPCPLPIESNHDKEVYDLKVKP